MRYRLMPVDGFAYMENQRYPVLRLGDEIELEPVEGTSSVGCIAPNKYIPVDTSKPNGFFTVPSLSPCGTVPELKKECGLHVWTEKASDNCPVCNRCGIHARDDYGWKRKECTEDIERVAEWLDLFPKQISAASWRFEVAKKLIEAGLETERLR